MSKRRPNIILTIADDQRGSAMGCAGVEKVSTPTLDALAARGSRFSQAQHFGSCHGGICAPSRAMLHTGIPYFHLDPSLLGGTYSTVEQGRAIPPTLGQKLREAGYQTFGCGKWHNGVRSFHKSFQSGASIFFGGMHDHWFVPVHDFDETGAYPPEKSYVADGFSTEIFAASAIDFIRSRAGNQEPFFCYCAFSAPHDPRTPPDAWRRKYSPTEIEFSPNIKPCFFEGTSSPKGVKPESDIGTLGQRDELLLGTPRDEKELQREIAAYYGMISHMDAWIGHIHAACEEIGELENTIIVHTSDHGLAVGQHGLMGKQNLYQHSLQVPLLLAGPGIPGGVTTDELCFQHDLNPTLLGLAGVEQTPGFFEDFLPVLTGEKCGRRHLTGVFSDLQVSIRDRRHKLIEYNVEGRQWAEAFDLEQDPWETLNIADRPEHQAKLKELKTELAAMQKRF